MSLASTGYVYIDGSSLAAPAGTASRLTVGGTTGGLMTVSGGTIKIHCGESPQCERQPMRYLYESYVIDNNDDIFPVGPFIAKDDSMAKIKAAMKAGVDPDSINVVIVQRLGEVPAVGDEE